MGWLGACPALSWEISAVGIASRALACVQSKACSGAHWLVLPSPNPPALSPALPHRHLPLPPLVGQPPRVKLLLGPEFHVRGTRSPRPTSTPHPTNTASSIPQGKGLARPWSAGWHRGGRLNPLQGCPGGEAPSRGSSVIVVATLATLLGWGHGCAHKEGWQTHTHRAQAQPPDQRSSHGTHLGARVSGNSTSL